MADFKAASSAVASLKVGTSSVSKVYAGADLIWSGVTNYADWDVSNPSVTIAGYAKSSTGQRIDVGYESASNAFGAYAMTSGNSIDATHIGWSSGSKIDVDMSNTVNTTPFAAAYPYVAYWNETDNTWRKGTADDRGAFKVDMIYSVSSPTLLWGSMDDGSQAVLFYTSDPGSVSGWTAYDGPDGSSDWTDNELGASFISRLDTNYLPHDYVQKYPLDSALQNVNRLSGYSGGSSPFNYAANGQYASPANQIKAPLFYGIWVSPQHDTDSGTAYGHNDDGWYVFKRNGYSDGTAEGGTPTSNGRAEYIPWAWPTGANNDDGYLGTGGSETYPFFGVALSAYSGTTGSGGTDSWTAPADWSSPRYTATFTAGSTGGSNFNVTNVSESGDTGDWEPYTWQPLRGSSTAVTLIWRASNSGSFGGNGNTFFADTKLQHARLRNITTGSEYDFWDSATSSGSDGYNSVAYGDSGSNEPWGSGNTFYLRFNYSSGDGTTSYAKISAGDTLQLDFYYIDD